MISLAQAYEIVIAAARPLPAERVPLVECRGRVLAEPVVADMAMPPFDKSMVDGYACRRVDLPGPLELVEVIAAGMSPEKIVGRGQCSKIMTGAPIPEGADCVFIVEHSREVDGRVTWTGEHTADNIVPRASDVREGETLLHPGHAVRPQDVAVLASMGYAEPLVARRPSVAVIPTGDELVEPGEKPGPSQIRNSNAYQLCGQVESAGGLPHYLGVARDTGHALHEKISDAIRKHDVVLLSGGVSMGDYDLVPGVLRENGVEILFDKIAVQPGKPTVFGVSPEAFCFGLPGNPVSTFAVFELLVKPFLLKLQGHDYRPPVVRAALAETFTRKVASREAWVPVTLDAEGRARRVEYHGSAHIAALSFADGLIAFPVGDSTLEEGRVVAVRLLRH
ncbi:MAG: gephyrin-like molybdotransferase Glp [Candidatus Hydrogenedentota bacterium]